MWDVWEIALRLRNTTETALTLAQHAHTRANPQCRLHGAPVVRAMGMSGAGAEQQILLPGLIGAEKAEKPRMHLREHHRSRCL